LKALLLEEYGTLSYTEVPDPRPAPDEVLVRVQSCGICGSDVHGYDGSSGRRIPPLVMGHEASGVVAEVGSSVQSLKEGERITFDSTVYCGDCWFCRRGLVNLCEGRQVLGVSCDDYRRHGAFAEYVVVPERISYRIPPPLTFDQAAMVEAVSVAVHAVGRTDSCPRETVVVVGSGMIGLLVLQVARAKECKCIVAVDIADDRLELARGFGADLTLNADRDDVDSAIRDLTHGRGADVAFEVVGFTPTIRTGIGALRKGGTIVLVGNLQPEVEIPLQTVVAGQMSLLGSCASSGEYPESLDLIADGKVDVDTFISATAPLSEGPDWFRRLYAGESGLMKVILNP